MQLAAITDEQWQAELLGLLRGDRTPAVQIVEATSELLRRSQVLHDIPTVPTWHRDRMIIVGNAAHSASASSASSQGASMAIEDGVTLAKCLRDASGVAQAFSEYERLRRERVEAVVAYGKRNGNRFVPGPVERILWNFFRARVVRKIAARDRSWILNYRIDWDERVAI